MEYPIMSTWLKPTTSPKGYKISNFQLGETQLANLRLRSLIQNRPGEWSGQEPAIITRLQNPYGTVMMSDTVMEHGTNSTVLRKANGDVLVVGLGLGMVVMGLQEKAEVKSITVIEIESDIIDMVAPMLPLNEKVQIRCADIFEWRPEPGKKYDTIYFDIWNAICGDNYEDMKKLRRKFGRSLNRGVNKECWMGCWCGEKVKELFNQEKNSISRIYNSFSTTERSTNERIEA